MGLEASLCNSGDMHLAGGSPLQICSHTVLLAVCGCPSRCKGRSAELETVDGLLSIPAAGLEEACWQAEMCSMQGWLVHKVDLRLQQCSDMPSLATSLERHAIPASARSTGQLAPCLPMPTLLYVSSTRDLLSARPDLGMPVLASAAAEPLAVIDPLASAAVDPLAVMDPLLGSLDPPRDALLVRAPLLSPRLIPLGVNPPPKDALELLEVPRGV